MIHLERNSSNTIAVRAPLTLTTAYILLWFYSSDTGNSVYCVAPDANSEGYAQDLDVEEVGSSTPDPLAGEVALSPRGEWRLRIYEQSSSTNLDPASATRMIYDDLCLVSGDADEDIEYTETNICAPGTVENSDSTYSLSVPSGVTTILPDITHTDSDGSPVVLPAQTPFVATVCSTVQNDFYYPIAIGHP